MSNDLQALLLAQTLNLEDKSNKKNNWFCYAILLSNMNRAFWHMNELKTDKGKEEREYH